MPFRIDVSGRPPGRGIPRVVASQPRSRAFAVTVSLQIRYNRYRPENEDNYPFIFIANAEVGGNDRRAALIQPRHPGDRGIGGRHVVSARRVPLYPS